MTKREFYESVEAIAGIKTDVSDTIPDEEVPNDYIWRTTLEALYNSHILMEVTK